MVDMTDRNKRLDDFGEYLKNHDLTRDDMLAVICGQLTNNGKPYPDNLTTKLMVAGRVFKIEIYEVAK